MKRISVLAAALGAGSVAATAQVPSAIAAPSVIIDAFGETCRTGFPDFELVARSALSSGWIERKTFVPFGSSLPAGVVLPRTFQKGDVTLALVTPNPAFPGSKRSCQVTAMARGKPDPQAYAGAIVARLQLGAPQWQGRGSAAIAAWRIANGNIQADIGRYHQVRSYSLRISD